MRKEIPTLKISTDWIQLIVIGEPDVMITFKGYAPVLPVKLIKNGLDYYMYISAKSLSEKLEPLRQNNNGLFNNLKLSIRKTSEDKFSTYDLKLVS
jgi:hypothetical protein